MDEVEIAVEIDVDQLQALVGQDRHVGGHAAIAECSVAVVEEQARAEQQVDEAILVEVHGLSAARHVGGPGRVGQDPGGVGVVGECAFAVIEEQPVAGPVAAGLVVRREQVDVAVVVEIRREQRAAEAAHAERRDRGRCHVLAVTLVDVQERDRVGVGRRRRNVAEDFVESVAVEVRKAHVRDLARAGGQIREAHLVEVPDRIAAAAGTRVDAAERRRQVEAVIVVHDSERRTGHSPVNRSYAR